MVDCDHISKLKDTLHDYGTDASRSVVVFKCSHSGALISQIVVYDILNATAIGSKSFLIYATDRLVKQAYSFLDSIKNVKNMSPPHIPHAAR